MGSWGVWEAVMGPWGVREVVMGPWGVWEAVMGLCGVWEGLSPSEGDAQVQVADLGETPSLDLEDLLYHHSGGG